MPSRILINYRVLVSLILLLPTAVVLVAAEPQRPNIVFILADDLGYGDVHCLNPQRGKIKTPHLDRLASEGMTFSDAHSGSSVCTPTRYGLLTGRYAWRTRLQQGVLDGGNDEPLIAKDRLTVGDFLKQHGYGTACLGKWHLGFQSDAQTEKATAQGKRKMGDSGLPIGASIVGGPTTRGFDLFWGVSNARTMSSLIENERVIESVEPVDMLPRLSERAVQYIKSAAVQRVNAEPADRALQVGSATTSKPFFLYLPLTSPHTPIVPSVQWRGKSGLGDYGDFVMQTDAVVGDVLAALEEHGLSENTLVVFSSDNGPHRVRLTGEWLDTAVETEVLTGLGPALQFGPVPLWTVDALNARDTTGRMRASLDWTFDGSPGDLVEYAFLSAYWQDAEDRQFAFEERTPLTPAPAPDRERLNTFENRVYGFAGEARSGFDLLGTSHRIAIGGDVSWTRQEGLRDGTVPPRGEVFPSRAFPVTDFTLGGLFLSDEITLFDGALTLFPALRFDFFELDPTDDPLLTRFDPADQSGSRLSPKLGVTLKLADDVILFGNYAQGFLAPTPSQVNNFFESFGATSIPNPDLGPETSESWEFGARYVGQVLSVQVTGFRGDYDDFISQQVISGGFTLQNPAIFQFVNFSGARIEGVEARAELRLESGWNARLAMAYADGETMDPDGVRLPLDTIDPFNLVTGVGYRAPKGKFGGELILTHNTRKAADELERAPDGSDLFVRPAASTVLDLTAFYAVTDQLKLRAGLFNLTDETYVLWSDVRGLRTQDAGILDAFTRPGRNVSLSISYRF